MSKQEEPINNQLFFKIYALIALIIIVIALVSVFKDKNNNDNSETLLDNNLEIVVDDGPQSSLENEPVKGSQDNSNNPQTGPASIEDLGGSNTSGNIEELLNGRDIEIEK